MSKLDDSTRNFGTTEIALKEPAKAISVGTILDDGHDTNKLFNIDLNTLKKHTLICGATGSGKTNTCFQLLQQLWRHKIPFLIIEPVKSEYRHLMLSSEILNGVGQVYTIGDETISPFRLNPFEIMKGVKVQSHIDALMSVFQASFEMYAPMPQVLGKALCEIYRTRGWDLVQNRNMRLPEGIVPGEPGCPDGMHPTMQDLYEIIDPITESFGYSERIGPDVLAALLSRIGGLMFGGRQQLFSRRCSVPLGTLFNRPVVLELKEIFNDSDKSFIAGTLLLLLYEYRKIQGPHTNLQHVLLIEDAHRLLKNDIRMQNDNGANPGAVFLQLFQNLLSEVGSYGEGIIASAQTPSNLMPEVLSNTNLKIIHRLLTNDDLNAVSGPKYLDDHQKRHIATLAEGQIVLYAENMPQPYNLRVKHDKTTEIIAQANMCESDSLVRETMRTLRIADSDKSSKSEDDSWQNDSIMSDSSTIVANDPLFRQIYNRYVLSTLKDLTQLVHFRGQIVYEVQRVMGGRARLGNLTEVMWGALVQATQRYFERKGEENYWFYDQVQEQYVRWLNLLKPAFQSTEGNCRLNISVLEQWRDGFLELHKRDQGPYPACSACTSKCVYKFEVSEVVRDPKVSFDFNSSINRRDTPAADSAAWFCRLLAERLIGQSDVDLAYCLAVQFIKDQQLSTDAQLVLLHKIRAALENNQNGDKDEETSGAPTEE